MLSHSLLKRSQTSLRPVRLAALFQVQYRSMASTTSSGGGDNDGTKGPTVPTGRGRRRRTTTYNNKYHLLSDGFFDMKSWPKPPTSSNSESSDKTKTIPIHSKPFSIEPISPFLESKFDPSGKKSVSMNMELYHQFMDSISICFDIRDIFQAALNVGTTRKKSKTSTREDLTLDNANSIQDYTDILQHMLNQSNPRTIRKHLDNYVIGQNEAKQAMSCAVYNHYSRVYHNLRQYKESLSLGFPSQKPQHLLEKSNILVLGPSGSGKTLIAKRIAEILKVPFSMNDATTFTQAGYVGDDVEQCISRLLANAGNDVRKCEIGIVFIDEIDKISKRSEHAMNASTRDVAGEGVQQALLKMLEGTTVHVTDKGSKKNEAVAVDTSNILFILSGAFVGMDRVVQERTKGDRSMGFGNKVSGPLKIDHYEALKSVNESDLIRYGLIPEFVGRVPLVVAVNRLTEDELVRILKEPKNSLVEQYTKLFFTWNVKLTFTDEALHAMARRVMERHTGARGLRFAMEEVLRESMYALPGSNAKSALVDGDLKVSVVEGPASSAKAGRLFTGFTAPTVDPMLKPEGI